MEEKDFYQQLFIFTASIITTAYELFSKEKQPTIKRTLIIGRILGSIIVAFAIMPGIMEWFGLSIKITIFFTVIVTYGFDGLLKVSAKKLSKTIENGNNSE